MAMATACIASRARGLPSSRHDLVNQDDQGSLAERAKRQTGQRDSHLYAGNDAVQIAQ